ncbi:NAD-dependent epimerase/dehydratase family protein [Nesterenkonia alba]|uniref:NAD-dependent epimerase/dehydratase family protein n=1 Tax=Nesterenkonia alba TaxID=515814 RepID=UPI0003B58DE5|nr:NAD-dependent epimerase/dehydratase family protein [Nesterenkonia alba]
MRIAIVGATGNTGTALLEDLAGREAVTGLLGIARRLPDTSADPYRAAEWATVDIQFPESRERLAELFTGYDAVIHLAWLIQPNSKRELLRRVNVDGTRHVLYAAADAGVKHIAVASSVGAYSPVEDAQPRDESWPTEGIPTSHYSVDKAAQERICDAFEADHPDITLARLRPGLIFQAGAGSEIQRYFAGRFAPMGLLSHLRSLQPGALPVPLPAGIRTQAVHARDAAAAYAQAVLSGAHGGYNICADDLLDAEVIAGTLTNAGTAGSKTIPLPAKAVREAVKLAHRSHVLPMDEGWLDMGTRAPVMSNAKARQDLKWQPTMTGAQALAELLEGMGEGTGSESVPMRPRRRARTPYPHPLPPEDHVLDDDIDADLMRQYLNDHLSGATAGLQRIRSMADDFVDTPVYPQLSSVAEQIAGEHAWLAELIERQGFTRPAVMAPLAWAGERVSRLKPYGTLPLKRSPSSLVLETELMMGAITAKRQGWKVIADHAEQLGVRRQDAEELIAAAAEQRRQLEEVHRYARRRAYRTGVETLTPQL